VRSFADRLNVNVIRGGNAPRSDAIKARPRLIRPNSVIDAEIELADPSLVRRCIERAQTSNCIA